MPTASEADLVLVRWAAALHLLLAAIFGFVGAEYARRYSLSFASVAGIYVCFVLQLALIIYPAVISKREWIVHYRWWLIVLWCIPYGVYAVGTWDWNPIGLARLLVIAIPVAAIYNLAPVRQCLTFRWQDGVVAIVLIGSVLGGVTHGIWRVPVNLDFLGRFYVLTIGVWSWTFLRPVPNLGYNFSLSFRVLRSALWSFVCFAALAAPLGFALRFIGWHPRWHGFSRFALDYLEIFLFVALLEETFFRGFLQTLLSGSFRSLPNAQAFVACLFGLFHILHAPFPNWRYVLLATLAGWFYGNAFVKGGSLLASSLTHALVDTLWRTFLTR